MSVDALIQAEVQRRDTLLQATGPISTRDAESLRDLPPPPVPDIPQKAQHLPAKFVSSPVSAGVYRFIQAEFTLPDPQRVTEGGIMKARDYTSDLLGVGLENVRVEVIPQHQWDLSAEGFQIKSGVEGHVVFVPERFSSPEELLCHEFAHAAHSTAQRRNGELPYFFANNITAEFVAHFCQFNYILDRLTRTHFASAMGQFTTATYALSIFSSQALEDFNEFIESNEAKAIREAMPHATLASQYHTFQQDMSYFFYEVQRGIGLMLALLLIDEREGMKRFISIDRIDHCLSDKLIAAFPESGILDAFPRINEQIFMLLDRFSD